MANIFFACAAVCLLLFVHPYLTYILSLRLLRSDPLALGTAPAPASATLVFTAYNEAVALPHKIDNLRAILRACPDLEIIAYSDGSSDETVALLSQAANVVRLISGPQRAGKAVGMRRLLQEAQGEIVIFTDANVILDPASIAPLLRYFTDPGVGGVAGSLPRQPRRGGHGAGGRVLLATRGKHQAAGIARGLDHGRRWLDLRGAP